MVHRRLLARPVVLILVISLSLLSTTALSRADDNTGSSPNGTPTAIPWSPATPVATSTPVHSSSGSTKSTTPTKKTTSKKVQSKPQAKKAPPKARTPAKLKTVSKPKTAGRPKGPSRPRAPARPRQPIYRPPPGWPQKLYIPKIKVAADVEHVALQSVADFKAPYKWGDVAWYDRGPKPGDLGRATIFGHLDSTCCPAVFYLLKDLRTGDTVQVQYKTGKALTFRVMWQATYPNDHLPISFLFGRVSERGLSLVTCAGVFHYDGTGYDHKLIVYARQVLPNGKIG